METAIALFKEKLTRYTRLPFYRGILVASGFGEKLAAFDRDKAKNASHGPAIPNRLAAGLGSIGNAHAVRQYVAAYLPAGVTPAAVRPIEFPDALHYRSTLEILGRCRPSSLPIF